MSIAISLVALALGYKVFADAHKEKEGLKLLGQIVGIIVMIAALMSTFCGLGKCMKKSECSMMNKSNCSMMEKTDKPTCPISHATEEAGK